MRNQTNLAPLRNELGDCDCLRSRIGSESTGLSTFRLDMMSYLRLSEETFEVIKIHALRAVLLETLAVLS